MVFALIKRSISLKNIYFEIIFKMSCLLRSPFTDNLIKHAIKVRALSSSPLLKSDKVPEEAIPKNLLEEYYSANSQKKGEIYDKRPFRVKLEANKKYAWCACGQSKSQPFCDGTHKIVTFKIKQKPIFLKVGETKEYWLCNCKQSDHRPFCDGTHLNNEIQEKIKHYKT